MQQEVPTDWGVVVRRIAATPARSAADAWGVIVDLVAAQRNGARQELDRTAGIIMSLIAAEAMKESPIVVHELGPRLRVYCLYDAEAILGEGASEDPLHWCPTDGEWRMSVPCPQEDLIWVRKALEHVSTRITARDQRESAIAETGDDVQKAKADLGPVDVEAFLRP